MLRQLKNNLRKTSIAWSYLNSLTQLIQNFQSDIFLISSSSVTILEPGKFTERRLHQIRKFASVESVTPLYFGSTRYKDPQNPALSIRLTSVIGFPLKKNVGSVI